MASLTAKSQSTFAKAAVRPRVAARRVVKVSAKYGEESRYFDMKDMENTTGSWDMYGQDSDKRYAGLQNTFFTGAADILTRRESLRTFVAISGIASLALFGLKIAPLVDLPITHVPVKTESGKGGSIRGKL